MYEHFRNDLVSQLSDSFSVEEVNTILKAVDKAAYNYEFSTKVTDIAVIEEFPQLVKMYLCAKKLEGCSDRTIKLYHNRLRIFFDFVNKDPRQVKTDDIRMFLAVYPAKNKIADVSLDKFRTILNGFYEWCVCEEYMPKNPCKVIKAIKFIQKERKALTRLQLEKLRMVAAEDSPRSLAIIDTLYSTACRVSELSNMKLEDINTENYSAQIIGKGSKLNTVYFNERARLSIDAYLEEREGNSDYLFCSINAPYKQLGIGAIERLVKKLGKRAGLTVTPHVLRHSAATLALKSGMPITQIQKMLGHAQVTTTQIYAKTSQEDVRYAHLKYVV